MSGAIKQKILLLTHDPTVREAVTATLSTDGSFGLGGVCQDLARLALQLDWEPAPIVLVDIDTDPQWLLSGLTPLVNRFPATRFVILAGDQQMQNGLILKAMKVGARYVQNRNELGAELTGALRQLLPEEANGNGHRGTVLTLISAGGGCGATTLAANLADELGLASGKPVLLMDMDASDGAVAAYLGLSGGFSLADVLARRDRIDSALITSTSLPFHEKLHVLLNPITVSLASPAPLHYENLDIALAACRQAYGHTVIDAPRLTPEVTANLAVHSDLTLLVLELNIKDLLLARRLMDGLSELGVPGDRFWPVVNRFQKRGAIVELAEVRRVLGTDSIVCIGNDYPSALRSINYGKLLTQAAPRSSLRRDLAQLAQSLARQTANGAARHEAERIR